MDEPFDADRLARFFVRFADTECVQEPLYDALCRIAAATPDVLERLRAAPAAQRRPNLLLAALHDLVLAGATHPLAAYYPSVGGTRAPDAALAATLLDFCARHDAPLQAHIATRTTQTNEVGRCAVLWPALQAIAAQAGRTRLALLDLGCSAGLNLGVDAYAYDIGGAAFGDAASPVPRIACRVDGAARPDLRAPVPAIVERLGIDPAPIDAGDADAVRWLRACLWPHDAPRRARLDAALRLALARRWPVRREADCTEAALRWVDALPGDVLPVVFNSWVLTYFTPDALERHKQAMHTLVQHRGAAWLSAEEPRLRIGDEAAPPLPHDADAQRRMASHWALMLPGAGAPTARVIARSHPHGKWLEWFGGDPR